MNDNNINPDENEDKMSYEEYIKSDPNYVEPDDLPSSFLSEEDVQPNDINVVIVPKFNPNFTLFVENLTERASYCKSKAELKSLFNESLEIGINHGIMLEKKDAMIQMIENFEINTKILSGEYGIEYYNENEDLD